MNEPSIGIDFGTCNSSAAWFNPSSGQAELLLNAEGEYKTPSVVYFGPDREIAVGKHAEGQVEDIEGRKRVLSGVKCELARKTARVIGDRRVTPLEAVALILRKIKSDAETGHFHEPVTRAVITCPAVFTEVQKDRLREAAALAGFFAVELLEEPVAAALAYAESGIKVGHCVLVYDLGGGTLDLAVLIREEGEDVFRPALEPRGEEIGGEDFDRAIYDYFETIIRNETRRPICDDGRDLHLLRQCRKLKETLSSISNPRPLSGHWTGLSQLQLRMDQAVFEGAVEKLVERTMHLTRAIQQDAARERFLLDSVILIGGSSRIPRIVRRLKETLQLEPTEWQKQYVAVALGAAYHAERIWGGGARAERERKHREIEEAALQRRLAQQAALQLEMERDAGATGTGRGGAAANVRGRSQAPAGKRAAEIPPASPVPTGAAVHDQVDQLRKEPEKPYAAPPSPLASSSTSTSGRRPASEVASAVRQAPSEPDRGIRPMTQPFIGIDFGTCNSSAAYFDPRIGRAELLTNAEGDDKTPSVVFFGPNQQVVVGRPAEDQLESPEGRKRVLSAVKRDLSKKTARIVGDRRVTPLEAAALILGKIKADAETRHFREPVTRAVITCPAVFTEVEKEKLREAAALAGFREVELLEEPVAAALAYAENGINVGRCVLVFDLGGGTLDLAVLIREEDEDIFRPAMEPRGERIGGEDFDRAIYDHFDTGVRNKHEQPICPDGLDLHLLRQCRKLKEILSSIPDPSPLSWYWTGKGQLKLGMNQARFERIIEKLVDRTMQLTRAIHQDAAREHFRPDSVILIGGSSRIPCIVRRLKQTLGLEPTEWQKQYVAVALGAAYHAERLWGGGARAERERKQREMEEAARQRRLQEEARLQSERERQKKQRTSPAAVPRYVIEQDDDSFDLDDDDSFETFEIPAHLKVSGGVAASKPVAQVRKEPERTYAASPQPAYRSPTPAPSVSRVTRSEPSIDFSEVLQGVKTTVGWILAVALFIGLVIVPGVVFPGFGLLGLLVYIGINKIIEKIF